MACIVPAGVTSPPALVGWRNITTCVGLDWRSITTHTGWAGGASQPALVEHCHPLQPGWTSIAALLGWPQGTLAGSE